MHGFGFLCVSGVCVGVGVTVAVSVCPEEDCTVIVCHGIPGDFQVSQVFICHLP